MNEQYIDELELMRRDMIKTEENGNVERMKHLQIIYKRKTGKFFETTLQWF